ncbi:MAG: type II secretion system F family protein [Proteobacteria bacterium]|nr:type II secretion system F family protein [Pseudomonadota bacterium]
MLNELVIGGTLAAFALISLALAVRAVRRRRASLPFTDSSPAEQVPATPLGQLGARLRPADAHELGALRSRLARAGLHSEDAVDLYLSVRLLLLILLFIAVPVVLFAPLSNLAVKVLILGALVLSVGVGPSIWLDGRTRERLFALGRTLPSTLDLLVTCLDAGLNLEQGLARVVARGTQRGDILARELGIALEEMRAGLSMGESFRRMAQRLDHPDVQNLAALIGQASALGGNVSSALRAHAEAMRAQRLAFLEEEAGKTNAKLTLPLVLCLLVSMLLMLFGPAILAIASFFQGQGS